MTYSKYLLNHIVRHGEAISRLKAELRQPDAWGDEKDPLHAVSFDAANFVWSFLASYGLEKIAEDRSLRNHIAEQIIAALKAYPEINTDQLKDETYQL